MNMGNLSPSAFMDDIAHFSHFQQSELAMYDLKELSTQPTYGHCQSRIAFRSLWRHYEGLFQAVHRSHELVSQASSETSCKFCFSYRHFTGLQQSHIVINRNKFNVSCKKTQISVAVLMQRKNPLPHLAAHSCIASGYRCTLRIRQHLPRPWCQVVISHVITVSRSWVQQRLSLPPSCRPCLLMVYFSPKEKP